MKSDKQKQLFQKELNTQKELHYAKLKLLSTNPVSAEEFSDMATIFPRELANSYGKMSPQADINVIIAKVESVSDGYSTLLESLAADTIIPFKNHRNLLNQFSWSLKLKKEPILDNLVNVFEKETLPFNLSEIIGSFQFA